MSIDDQLNKLDSRIWNLKKEFELYFLGDRRIAPLQEKQSVQRELVSLQTSHISNTHQKFRLGSIVSKFNSFSRLWERNLQQIDLGTFRPNKFKADMRVGKVDEEGSVQKSDTHGPSSDKAKEDEKQVHTLYKTYIETRRVTGEKVNVSYDSFKRSIDKNKQVLSKKYGDSFEFKITIEGGKAKVKGLVRRK